MDNDEQSLPTPALSRAERNLRKKFVAEYMRDYSAMDACIRLGYRDSFAESYARKFLLEPYVKQLLAEEEGKLGLQEQEKHKRFVLANLYREATSRFNSGAARVAANTQIAKITGMEAPAKVQQVLPQIGESDLSTLPMEDVKALEKILGKAIQPAGSSANPNPT